VTKDLSVPRALYRMVDGRPHCRHGAILYGTSCLTCEREAQTATGQGEQERWASGWDLGAPGGDKTAYARATRQQDGFAMEWVFMTEDLRSPDLKREQYEEFVAEMREHSRRIEDRIRESIRRAGSAPWPTPRQEVISDPNDRRGLDARPVRQGGTAP
jgi:hypothetical protein